MASRRPPRLRARAPWTAAATVGLLALALAPARGQAPPASPPPPPSPSPSPSPAAGCPVPAVCRLPPPPVGAPAGFRHTRSRLVVAQGAPRHRGRDLLLRPDDPQWLVAKLAYGPADDDLEDEDVEVWLARDCRRWELLATARTSSHDGQHPEVEGVADDEGRVFVRVPDAQRLGPGWHRALFVVRGDGTRAGALLRVAAPGTRVVVSDVDGTLSESETAAFTSTRPARANPGAARALWTLARRGYDVLYLTARPEWMVGSTRRWLADRGFPPGLVRTTLTATGLFGDSARDFKTSELRAFADRLGHAPDLAFGNMPSDVEAYASAGVPARGRYFYRLRGDARGGRVHPDYRRLVPELRALPAVCR